MVKRKSSAGLTSADISISPTTDRAHAALLELKEAIREAHEVCNTLRMLTQDAATVTSDIKTLVDGMVGEIIAEKTVGKLEEFTVVISRYIEQCTNSVLNRFDTLRNTLLGETPEQHAIAPSIPDTISSFEDTAKAWGVTLPEVLKITHENAKTLAKQRHDGKVQYLLKEK